MLPPQTRITIHYPARSHVLRDWPLRPRDVTIASVRDLLAQPLTVAEFTRRPYIRRSRWLARAFDHDIQQWRNFYLGCTPEFAAPSVLRVGVFDKETMKLLRLISRQFEPTIRDRRLLRRMLVTWESKLDSDEQLGIFAPDLRLVDYEKYDP